MAPLTVLALSILHLIGQMNAHEWSYTPPSRWPARRNLDYCFRCRGLILHVPRQVARKKRSVCCRTFVFHLLFVVHPAWRIPRCLFAWICRGLPWQRKPAKTPIIARCRLFLWHFPLWVFHTAGLCLCVPHGRMVHEHRSLCTPLSPSCRCILALRRTACAQAENDHLWNRRPVFEQARKKKRLMTGEDQSSDVRALPHNRQLP